MHFCSQCSNMYYISINPDEPNKLVYYCRNCGNKDSNILVNDVTVSKIQLKKSEQDFFFHSRSLQASKTSFSSLFCDSLLAPGFFHSIIQSSVTSKDISFLAF